VLYGRLFRRLQILWRFALKVQIGKDDDKKESEYQKYIYYASKGYQYYGESGQRIGGEFLRAIWLVGYFYAILTILRVSADLNV
jgi:hypothetical protein